MTKIIIRMDHTATLTEIVELPDGKRWDDVEDYFVKWGTLHLQFKGDKAYQKIDCSNDIDLSDSIDFKRPDRVAIYAVDDNCDGNYDTLLAEQDSR